MAARPPPPPSAFRPPQSPLADFARLPLDRVKAGPLAAGLYEPGRGGKPARLLLAAGAVVSEAALARLKARGVTDFVVDRRHLDAVADRPPGRRPGPRTGAAGGGAGGAQRRPHP